MTDESLHDGVRRLLEASQQRSALAQDAYAALKSSGRLPSHRVLVYRCPRRCLLLDVLAFPQGVVFHQPPYKRSPALNARTSSESGRAKNTTAGERHWKAQTYFAKDADTVGFGL